MNTFIDNDNIVVSVCCITYNHEDYIRDAIEGFLKQQTDFGFEVIIHDDASTDKTAQIIKEYQEIYPRVIKPIIQEENQYSQGVRGIAARFTFPKAKGKFIALCEGDDYWKDPMKLQKQVDFLKNNPTFSSCFHATEIIEEGTKFCEEYRPQPLPQNGICKNEHIVMGGGGYIPTASVMHRIELIQELPDWIKNTVTGDYALNVFAASRGQIGYIDEVMSVYRKHSGGVWSSKDKYGQFETMLKSIESLIPYFPEFEHLFFERLNKIIGTQLFKAVDNRDFEFTRKIIYEWYNSDHNKKRNSFYYFLGIILEKLKSKAKFKFGQS